MSQNITFVFAVIFCFGFGVVMGRIVERKRLTGRGLKDWDWISFWLRSVAEIIFWPWAYL